MALGGAFKNPSRISLFCFVKEVVAVCSLCRNDQEENLGEDRLLYSLSPQPKVLFSFVCFVLLASPTGVSNQSFCERLAMNLNH